jgi:hypothetical protein
MFQIKKFTVGCFTYFSFQSVLSKRPNKVIIRSSVEQILVRRLVVILQLHCPIYCLFCYSFFTFSTFHSSFKRFSVTFTDMIKIFWLELTFR